MNIPDKWHVGRDGQYTQIRDPLGNEVAYLNRHGSDVREHAWLAASAPALYHALARLVGEQPAGSELGYAFAALRLADGRDQ